MSPSVSTFHGLPAEMKMQIVEKLNEEDRMNLAALNQRFSKLDLMTGHRKFDFVQFNADDEMCVEFGSGENIQMFNRYAPIDHLTSHFHCATTKTLIIMGRLDEETEIMLQSVIKNIQFDKLIIDVVNYKSHRQVIQKILCQLVEKCNSSVEVVIKWKIAETGNGISKKMILNLPDIVKQRISVFICDESFIDDEIFLHLLGKSSGRTVIDCPQSVVSKAALKSAFEMISSGVMIKEVICGMNKTAFLAYFEELFLINDDDYEYNPMDGEFTHIETGAKVWIYKEEDDSMIVEMGPPQK